MQTQEITTLTIREFIAADYSAVTRLYNIMYADFAKDVDEICARDGRYPEYCRWARWVAECDGQVVAFVEYHQNNFIYHPRKFAIDQSIDPTYCGRGIGTRLFDQVMRALEEFEPISVDTWCREDMPELVSFLERRGFVANMRMFTSACDITTFEPSEWASRVAAVQAQGIQLRSLEALGPADASVRDKVYELWKEVRDDVPLPPGEVRTEVSFEQFWAQTDTPSLFPAGYFIGLDGDEYVGTSQLFRSPRASELRTGLTGVRREYRRRGIAVGLKVHALTFARSQGYQRVITDNAAVNEGMLAINRELGFVRNPPWVQYVKSFAQ